MIKSLCSQSATRTRPYSHKAHRTLSCWVNMVAGLLCHTWIKSTKKPGTDLNAYYPTLFFPIQEVNPIFCGPKRQVTSYKTSVGMCWANMVGLLCPHLDSTERSKKSRTARYRCSCILTLHFGTSPHRIVPLPYNQDPCHTTYCSRVVAFVDGSSTYIPR